MGGPIGGGRIKSPPVQFTKLNTTSLLHTSSDTKRGGPKTRSEKKNPAYEVPEGTFTEQSVIVKVSTDGEKGWGGKSQIAYEGKGPSSQTQDTSITFLGRKEGGSRASKLAV